MLRSKFPWMGGHVTREVILAGSNFQLCYSSTSASIIVATPSYLFFCCPRSLYGDAPKLQKDGGKASSSIGLPEPRWREGSVPHHQSRPRNVSRGSIRFLGTYVRLIHAIRSLYGP